MAGTMRTRTLKAPLLAAAFAMVAAPASATVKDGVEKYVAGDYKGAMAEWLPYAAQGDADALFNLGQLYKLGRGVPKNPKTATDYFRRAAQKGHVAAQTNLGILLFEAGEKAEAARWWTQAAGRNDPRAQYMLGIIHFNGDTVAKNWPLAYAYMLRASNAGLPQAQTALNTMNANISIGDRQRGEQIASSLATGASTPQALVDARPAPRRIANPAPKGGKTAAPATVPGTTNPLAIATAAAATPPTATPPRSPAVAPPAETPVVPPKASSAAAGKNGWRVQLGAFSQRETANEAWVSLKADQAAALGTVQPIFAAAGDMIRLQLGPFGTRDDAKRLCGKLTAVGRSCFVVPAP